MCLTPPRATRRSRPAARPCPRTGASSTTATAAHDPAPLRSHRSNEYRGGRIRALGRGLCRGLLLLALTTVTVLGAGSAVQAAPAEVLALAKSLDEVLSNLQLWLLGIFAGLATLFLIVGGGRCIVSGETPASTPRASWR